MKPDVEKLQNDPGYRQILELDFNDMIPFVLSNIRRKGILSFLYAGINLGMLVFIILHIISGLTVPHSTWSGILRQSVTGIFSGSILIIPVHELLHVVAYRILGARKIRFGADMKQFIFYVTADRYPVSGNELYYLAMFPFVMINIVAVFVTLTWFPGVILFSAFLLLSHNVMCIGDFAIVNYIHGQSPRKIFTFDETELKKSFFYEEVIDQQGESLID